MTNEVNPYKNIGVRLSDPGTQSQASKGATGGNKKELGQAEFLKLMIAQVQHQDPLEPQTNGDFIAQMAQFSTSDGIGKMQKSIESLSATLQSSQALQASSLVGRNVLVNNNKMTLDESNQPKFMVYLPASVSDMTMNIYSTSGDLIRTVPLGIQGQGQHQYNWDGLNQKGERVPSGDYIIQVDAMYQNQPVGVKTLTTAKVNSVTLGQNGQGMQLNVAGVGNVSLNDIHQITD